MSRYESMFAGLAGRGEGAFGGFVMLGIRVSRKLQHCAI